MQVQINAVLKNGHQRVMALVECNDLFSWGAKFAALTDPAQRPPNIEKVIVAELSAKNAKVLEKYKSAWFDPANFGVDL